MIHPLSVLMFSITFKDSLPLGGGGSSNRNSHGIGCGTPKGTVLFIAVLALRVKIV